MRDQSKCIRVHISALDGESTIQGTRQIFLCMAILETKTFWKVGVQFCFLGTPRYHFPTCCLYKHSINVFCHDSFKHTYYVKLVTNARFGFFSEGGWNPPKEKKM